MKIDLGILNSDLSNEYKHWHFYMHSAIVVKGLHRAELREFFLEQAASEMKHIQQFGEMIQGLGGKPTAVASSFPVDLEQPKEILQYAYDMEMEVVKNYAQRMVEGEEIGGVDGSWMHVFYETQLQDSREDADNIKEMLNGSKNEV